MSAEPDCSDLDAARCVAEEELAAWPRESQLRYSRELSTPDVHVFLVMSATGQNCGTVSVTMSGGLITRVLAEPSE